MGIICYPMGNQRATKSFPATEFYNQEKCDLASNDQGFKLAKAKGRVSTSEIKIYQVYGTIILNTTCIYAQTCRSSHEFRFCGNRAFLDTTVPK